MALPPTPRHQGNHRPVLLLFGTLVALVATVLLAAPSSAEVVDLDVPYHAQVESWYCAEASLQMVFDYWGEEVPQHDIGDVANERAVGGTYASDLARAARFSNLSAAYQPRENGGARLQGYDQRAFGYAAHVHQWTSAGHVEERYRDLKDLIRAGYPVILLCWLDIEHEITHFRVVKGFDTDTGDFLVHDPALGGNLRFNMTLLVDDLWLYYDRWGMVVVPWTINTTAPVIVGPGNEFTVSAEVTYPCPPPFNEVEKVYTRPVDARVTISVPPPFSLVLGEDVTKDLNITKGGDVDTVTWRVVSPSSQGFWTTDIGVTASANVTDYAISYGWYTDLAGGVGQAKVDCDAVPPEIVSLSVAGGKRDLADPTVSVAYITRDDHTHVETVRLSLDGGGSWMTLESPSGGLDVTLDQGDGLYEILFNVVDAVGNDRTVNRTLHLDTTPPTIMLFQLAGGEDIITTMTFQVTVVAEDAAMGIDMMSVRLGASQWGIWEPYREDLQLSHGTDGELRVDIRIRDKVGNTATASDTITIDTTAPYITRFEVAAGLPYSQASTVPVTFSAEDGMGDDLQWSVHEEGIGGVQFEPGRTLPSGGTHSMEWTFQVEGDRTLNLVVRDRAGHTAEASATVVVDTRPPILTMVLNGGEEVTTSSEIPVAVDVMDETTEVTKARIRVNGNQWGPWSDPGVFRRVDLGPGEGMRTVHVQAQDLAGNLAEVSGSVYVDTIVPTLSVEFTSTRPGGIVAGDTDIILTFSEEMTETSVGVVLMDNSSGVMDCMLEWTENGTRLVVDPERSLPRGSHFVLQVSGEDRVGNELDFPGVLFSTPEAEEDDWDAVLPGDSRFVLLILALVIVAVFVMAFGMARRKR
ncbi:MAG: C39 family peptidase [Thermoplasmata archaeon]|nr:MAG: C39 family peptidase [Thermoplasmata archaeon]